MIDFQPAKEQRFTTESFGQFSANRILCGATTLAQDRTRSDAAEIETTTQLDGDAWVPNGTVNSCTVSEGASTTDGDCAIRTRDMLRGTQQINPPIVARRILGYSSGQFR